jgi:hypothetical protein
LFLGVLLALVLARLLDVLWTALLRFLVFHRLEPLLAPLLAL